MNETQTPSKRRIIFVLGMHRSGTSLATNVLSELGVALSEDLMPATHENAKGYFESQTISLIQEQILRTFSVAWDTSFAMRALPSQWWNLPQIAELRAMLIQFVRAELDKHPVWAFKDPRTMRLLPLWGTIIPELDAEPTFLLVTRNPNEVIGSLLTRNKLDPVVSELLWLEHNADALLSCRNQIAAMVDYQEWIDRPLEQARYMIEKLHLSFSGSDEDLRALLARVIEPELRHHAGQTNYQLPFTGPLYEALLRRDLPGALSLADLFGVGRNLTSTVAVPLYRKLAELTNANRQMAARIAELEAQNRALTAPPAAEVVVEQNT